MTAPVVVVGDTLLDRDVEGRVERVSPDAPVPVVDQRTSAARAGGAGLAAALLAAEGRRPVILVTALADDAAGGTIRTLLAESGVRVLAMPMRGTTAEKVRIRSSGQTLLRVDRGGEIDTIDAGDPGVLDDMADAAAVLVADYGKGVARQTAIRASLAEVARSRPVVWDPHPRGPVPVPGCRLATPNRTEAAAFTRVPGDGLVEEIARARRLLVEWEAGGVAVTLGAEGAVLVDASGTPLRIPAPCRPAGGMDPCGAGDRFSATAAAVLADGGLLSDAVIAAVEAASDFVMAGGVSRHAGDAPSGVPDETAFAGSSRGDERLRGVSVNGVTAVGRHGSRAEPDPFRLAERVRRSGGTVVATGGCFDVLHAGHIRTLEAARALGDCLIVCLNSDESIRARKGRGRPVVPAADRAAILSGLRCVDAVAVFPDPTPEALLRELEPHIWAKGADYTLADLPEAATVASWGGETVVLPYLDGRSTSELLKEAFRDA